MIKFNSRVVNVGFFRTDHVIMLDKLLLCKDFIQDLIV